jgi:hemoglobin
METMFDQIGGEPAVAQLVNRFYDLIETLPQGEAIMNMHRMGHGLDHARSAQFDFLCGFFGGRQHYQERHGHMNLREIHAHVQIARSDAENWLTVMNTALTDTKVQQPMKGLIMSTFRRVALMLVNSRDG